MPGHADHDRIIYYCNITKADRSDRIAFHLQVAPVRSAGETHPALVLGVPGTRPKTRHDINSDRVGTNRDARCVFTCRSIKRHKLIPFQSRHPYSQIHGALGAEIAAAAAARVQAVTADELIAEKAALVHHDVGRLA